MISYLKGHIVDEAIETVTIDVNGVGYQLFCSQNTLDHFFGAQEVTVWVHTHVREDAFLLYGFATKMEKQIFESLIKVNGVGPKMALKILSGAAIGTVAEMIESADVKSLMKLPKVGKKTAEQIILTLKGKLQIELSDNEKSAKSSKSPVMSQVHSALVNLGFRSSDVEEVVETLPKDISFEAGVREGLALLSGN